MIPYLALMTAMFVFFGLGYEIKDMVRGPYFLALASLFYVVILWLAYVKPLGDHLILHERGFRIVSGGAQPPGASRV